MPFKIALSGLNAAMIGLKTTANNIANVGTAGFKGSRAEFAEVVAAGDQDVGSGVRTARIAEQEQPGVPVWTETGFVESSNVDLTEQLVNMIKYSQQAEVQLSVIRTAAENEETVTDMLSKG